jgi:hypothetical protein
MLESLNKPLSEHFKLYEMMRSQTASRLEIDNTPSPQIILAGMALGTNVLDPIREEFGSYSPTSWYRAEELERILTRGSFGRWAKWKRKSVDDAASWHEYFLLKSHPKGEAADVDHPRVSNDRLFRWIQENLEFDEVIREYAVPGESNSGWVHVSFSLEHNRNRVRNIG